MFTRGDRVAGWFGTGIVTDVPLDDDVMRIIQSQGRHGKRTFRYVRQVDARLDSTE